MTRICISPSAFLLSCFFFSLVNAAWAQDAAPAIEPQPDASVETTPAAEAPETPPAWTYERQTQNQQGSATNTHRYLDLPEEGRYVREHVVTNPHGEMTQTRERLNTDEGYRYRHSQTMERSFIGPNGQTRESQRSWTPNEASGNQPSSVAAGTQPSSVSPTTAPPMSEPAEKVSWWQKLNPFRKKGSATAGSAASSAPGRGFTIGTPGANSAGASSFRSGGQASVHASQDTHRPSWAGGAARSMSPQGSSSQASGMSTAARPNLGRGNNR